ncbi:hypothetical protein GCM10011348_45930 [Marinobacterium nitratireducens]|uniref:Fungal lipase-type domain-containing protein n=1 Tax=Marinobacterium nitratireducens TaxID=518897 RepID=A0A917ZPT3_9GAMM|nr:hypothetical protein [Marinobacterium nitratireducens]GGO89061.1 hypothetical protein GCM10011348_45930 [Marinobacterium nitratireducens]
MAKQVSHLELAHLCSRVYDARGPEVRSRHETDVLIEDRGDVIILAVRGTEWSNAWPRNWSWEGLSNLRDVARDLWFFPWKDPVSRTWVHSGFGWSALTWFRRYRTTLQKTNTRYIVTGHSLGAAIAPQLARMMKLHGWQIDEVVLFGEPGGHYWGSRDNYAALNIPTTSYRTRWDWIQAAGYGRTVPRTILETEGLGPRESHQIEAYVESMAAQELVTA